MNNFMNWVPVSLMPPLVRRGIISAVSIRNGLVLLPAVISRIDSYCLIIANIDSRMDELYEAVHGSNEVMIGWRSFGIIS